MTAEPTTTSTSPNDSSRDERWYLGDEQDFLCRSLEDARLEHEAGDLADEDYDVLVARDSARLAEVEAALAALGPEPTKPSEPAAPGASASSSTETDDAESAASRPMALWRKVGIGASCLLIVAGVAILVVHFVQTRQPGQASSGSISVSQAQTIEQQLAQAASLADSGNAKNEEAALVLYNDVLSEDPSNPAALAGAGWLMWNLGTAAHVAGYIQDGRAEVTRAIKVSPTYYQGHLYLGLILANQDHNNAAAVVQFDEFLADNPPSDELPAVAADLEPSYLAVGKAVPPGLAASTTTTTTTTKPSTP